MSVRLKMTLSWKRDGKTTISDPENPGKSKEVETCELSFSPVTSGSDENKQFFALTPAGRLEFQTVNRAAAESLIIGKEYFVVVSEQ